MEEVHRLDIRYMKQHGLIRLGSIGSLSWFRGDQQTGSIGFRVKLDCLVLDYRYRSVGGDWEPVQETIWLDWTACHYGGQRPWFRCPWCFRRVAVLCGYGKRFLCRHCYRLPYASQQETYQDRMMQKARKIRERVGASMNLFEPIWQKPKGMHWTTFERLLQLEECANDASLEALWRRFERL
jgi:hypothetical protein